MGGGGQPGYCLPWYSYASYNPSVKAMASETPLPAKPFAAGGEIVAGARVIDGEDAVEVIHLVLDELGQGPFGFEAVAGTGAVLVFNHDAEVTAQPDHEIREREAVVPQFKSLRALFQADGIDQLVAAAVHLEEDDAERLADLDGADTASEAVAAAEIGEGVGEVGQNAPDFRGAGGRRGDHAEQRVAEFEDAARGHGFIVRQRRQAGGSGKLGLMLKAGGKRNRAQAGPRGRAAGSAR